MDLRLPGEAKKERWFAGELLHHLTFLKLLKIVNLSLIDVTYLTGSAGQIHVWTALGEYLTLHSWRHNWCAMQVVHNTTLALP